jgi:hypothetical protein
VIEPRNSTPLRTNKDDYWARHLSKPSMPSNGISPRSRNSGDLQLEAAAHIAVQAAIDTGAIDATQAPSALAVEIHRQFHDRLPDSLRWVEELESGRQV